MRSREEQIDDLAVVMMDEGGKKEASYAFSQETIDAAILLGRELERAEMATDIRDAQRWRTHVRLLFKSGRHTVAHINEAIRYVDAAMNAENGQ
ncbi:hypothetical protein AA11826_0358 [Komagataeibacter oboediens DSM 11826]|uniref:Uncharacterized protein n=1 Tax=Komagataeibacter oboediens TaxID=65958 RepID=A0A318QTQ3_9PROT|nr:hypothetical protein [Komagataeibacter oboediens]PYD81324.1 hypothetical protein CFR80_12315 [Komagataeibacter oboediens]GBR28823.1 hypothetical protein AA11826_0358 [Komagataeibacter oboediens DSM 11826]